MAYFDYYGIPLPKLDNGAMPLGAVVCLKTMDSEGHIHYQEFKSPEIHSVEALGMVTTFKDTLAAHLMNGARKAGEDA